ncbi:MAG: transposase, partial [Planctomycetes bacterium]|nr:transposase [Planctomycetota bacterium]
ARSTPCDQDYLRKLAKQTDPKALEDWYNRQVAQLYGQLGAYDEEGIFVGDGSYLFVPDNEHYEGSLRLLFDEHNHPVSKEEEHKMTPAQRKRCRWRRCFRVVFLLHCDRAGERFVVAGLKVLRANQAEGPGLWELVDTFVAAVGRGVIKVLVVDRGFIDGPQIGRLKTEYGVDTVIPIRKNMDILQDVRGIVTLDMPWEEYRPSRRDPLKASRPKSAQHPTVRKRERKRQKTLAKKRAEAQRRDPLDPSEVLERTMITKVPGLTSWSDCPVPLTGAYSKDCFADGHERDWLLVTTNPRWTAKQVCDNYGLRTDIEERHRQIKCFWDLTRFYSTAWNLVVNQVVFVCLTYSLLQLYLLQHGHQELNRRTSETTRRLLPDGDRVIIYRQQYFAFFTLLEHTELTLKLEGEARRKALAKIRRLKKENLPQ